MSRVRQRGTAPELCVRKILRARGDSFRLNVSSLPGSPDLVDPICKRAVFVHGCFWHRHYGCKATTTPRANRSFWLKKFSENVARDRRVRRRLRRMGFSVLTVWECQTKSGDQVQRLARRIQKHWPSLG